MCFLCSNAVGLFDTIILISAPRVDLSCNNQTPALLSSLRQTNTQSIWLLLYVFVKKQLRDKHCSFSPSQRPVITHLTLIELCVNQSPPSTQNSCVNTAALLTHTHTHTRTHVCFCGLRGLSIGVMVFILYNLYVL